MLDYIPKDGELFSGKFGEGIDVDFESAARQFKFLPTLIIIKLSTLIFTALSAFKTTIDVLNQTFKLSDGIILLGVIALFVTTLFIDSAGRKK